MMASKHAKRRCTVQSSYNSYSGGCGGVFMTISTKQMQSLFSVDYLIFIN